MAEPVAVVEAIAVRTVKRGSMKELNEVDASAGGGLTGDVPADEHRGITLISSPQWREVTRELDVNLPWHTRRANVLVSAARLGGWIGRTIKIGDVVVEITGETRPCALMDELCPGLRTTLAHEVRAGVHGRIMGGGVIRVGDTIYEVSGSERE